MNKGFTLLEAMITMVLLATGMTAVFGLFSTTVTLDKDNDHTAVALDLCQEKMEEIKDAEYYGEVDTMSSERSNLGGDFSDFDREVTVAGDPKKVKVKVYWTDKGGTQSVELVTLLADYDY